MGFFYIPHGAIMGNTSHGAQMDNWTPSGSGANFKLSPIMKSLEPYKKYVTSFGNLKNEAMVGGVHSRAPATWLSGVKPDDKAPGANMSATLDQVVAGHISQGTTLPSLELASETTIQVAACGGAMLLQLHAVFPRRDFAAADGIQSTQGLHPAVWRRRHQRGTRCDFPAERQPSRSHQ